MHANKINSQTQKIISSPEMSENTQILVTSNTDKYQLLSYCATHYLFHMYEVL